MPHDILPIQHLNTCEVVVLNVACLVLPKCVSTQISADTDQGQIAFSVSITLSHCRLYTLSYSNGDYY